MGVGRIPLADRIGRWRLGGFSAGSLPVRLGDPPDAEALWSAHDGAAAGPRVSTRAAAAASAGRGPVVDFRFASRAAGVHPAAATVCGRLFHAPRPDAPCVVLVHGLGAGRPAFEERLARREWRRGRSALHLVLPGHGPRRLPGCRSGDGFLCADPVATRANLLQATLDVVDCVRWVRAAGARHVGVLGFSLGGLVACLSATCARLDRMVAVTPPVDLAWTGIHLLARRARRNLGLDRVSPAVAEAQLRSVIPRLLAPRTAPAHIGLLAASRDGVVGCAPVLELARAWGVGWTWIVPRGHMTAVVGFGWVEELVAFAQGLPAQARRLPRPATGPREGPVSRRPPPTG